jgi:DNA-binding phage protein
MKPTDVFGPNLATLIDRDFGGNVAEAARALGVHRTQMNRFLDSASWPKPDVLSRVCKQFKVDARVLLEPLEEIDRETFQLMAAE